jgi:membrane associated rhomboid family serine protease
MPLAGRPTLQTLVAILVVFAVQQVTGMLGTLEAVLFVLGGEVSARPWVVVTSVYAHAGLGHLLANAVALVVVGPLVGRQTTVGRYHAFFITTGALAGLAEIFVGGLLGPPRAVIGASGAVLALLGYVLAGNAVSTRVLDRVRLSPRAQLLLLVVVVVVLTLATSGPRSAVVGHAVGLTCGLVAGRLGLLADTRRRPATTV